VFTSNCANEDIIKGQFRIIVSRKDTLSTNPHYIYVVFVGVKSKFDCQYASADCVFKIDSLLQTSNSVTIKDFFNLSENEQNVK
jgi:hypothetical protein